jgi:phospholipase C
MDQNELRQRVDTIVIVLMGNRSFDHILGSMCLSEFGGRSDLDGVKSLVDPNNANPSSNGTLAFPFIMKDGPLTNDLPHERDFVAMQLASSAIVGGPTMTGFVKAYEKATGTSGVNDPPPMGLLTPPDLPATGFLAREYAVCDRWFAPLPASTQPNRLMALSGYSERDFTISGLLPNQDTLFDWLDRHQVPWRVYSAGISFFTLMPKLWPALLTDKFRRLSALSFDFQHEPANEQPHVIVIEPDYDDSPVHLSGHSCDNHPPLPMAFGEAFVRQVYEALTSNPGRWQRTVMLLTYDEHGGFRDHVPPLPVTSPPPPGVSYPEFTTTGVRVPAVIVSPLVKRGSAKHPARPHLHPRAARRTLRTTGRELFESGRRAGRRRHQVSGRSVGFRAPSQRYPANAGRAHLRGSPTRDLGRSQKRDEQHLHHRHRSLRAGARARRAEEVSRDRALARAVNGNGAARLETGWPPE